MNIFIKIATSILILIFTSDLVAQDETSHEVGFISGSASFTTDYGQRDHFMSNVGGNVGIGVGVIYYLNFTDYRYRWNQRTGYFAEHFRIRAELSYMAAELDHFGKWVEKESVLADKLKAHHGKTYLVNLGAQLEFHIVDIVDFGSRRIPDLQWSPYISAGAMVDFYNPSISSDAGDWRDPGVLYPKWDINQVANSARDTAGITMSATLGIGTRYKVGEYADLLIESRWQYFFSNYVDGLNSRPDPANKFNDWLLWVHVGYVYYLN
ncbi:glutamate dehydrogenase [Lutibacter sp.]|uniref:THC0290_0291 family protein n=1 Tax=Lutibacter sp. TaxID=1925666 RepID=UPI0027338A2E|nr:glutamate dehydrogenase [Lutibacter sp.]MDP3314269.1 glutamate dehydrogenase [Lutibacter sp.]